MQSAPQVTATGGPTAPQDAAAMNAMANYNYEACMQQYQQYMQYYHQQQLQASYYGHVPPASAQAVPTPQQMQPPSTTDKAQPPPTSSYPSSYPAPPVPATLAVSQATLTPGDHYGQFYGQYSSAQPPPPQSQPSPLPQQSQAPPPQSQPLSQQAPPLAKAPPAGATSRPKPQPLFGQADLILPPRQSRWDDGGRLPPPRGDILEPRGLPYGGRMGGMPPMGGGMPPMGRGGMQGSIGPPGAGGRSDGFQDQDNPQMRGSRPDTAGEIMEQKDTIFIEGIPDMGTPDMVAEFFSQAGDIQLDHRGEPKVHMYKDKMTGRSKGEATVSFQSLAVAQEAIEKFHGTYFPGGNTPMKITIATSRPSQRGRGGMMNSRSGGYMDNRGGGGRNSYGGRGNSGGYMNMPPRQGGPGPGYQRGPPRSGSFPRATGANMEARVGDWICLE
ncbi:unnamed protein product [Soboliphyme baturini]|uniref:RRM domain-containing protein n=1 Tax=Soboliphyme baturini TaxID=241478 RepID=A0A183IH36_9BILA|nr:unnamed protein product [Soboliphyme baturini]